MALGGAAGEPVSRLALEEPSLFCIRRPVTKKKRRKGQRRRTAEEEESARTIGFSSLV